MEHNILESQLTFSHLLATQRMQMQEEEKLN